VPRSKKGFDVRVGQMHVPRRNAHHQLAFDRTMRRPVFAERRVGAVRFRRSVGGWAELAEHDAPDDALDVRSVECSGRLSVRRHGVAPAAIVRARSGRADLRVASFIPAPPSVRPHRIRRSSTRPPRPRCVRAMGRRCRCRPRVSAHRRAGRAGRGCCARPSNCRRPRPPRRRGPHHGPFRFHKQKVAVEISPHVDARHAQDGSTHVEFGEHRVGVGSERHAGPRVHVASDKHQVRPIARREQARDRQRVGHDLQRSSDEQPCEFVGRAASVEQNGVSILDQLGRGARDGPLPSPLRGLPIVEVGHLRRRPRVQDAAVRPFRGSVFLERVPQSRRTVDSETPS